MDRAISWLKIDNPHYGNIVVDAVAPPQLPQRSQLPGIPKMTEHAVDLESDTGPQQEGAPGDVEDASGSFLRCAEQSVLEYRAIEALLRGQISAARRTGTAAPVTAWPGMEETALNEFKTVRLVSLPLPTLFPWGKGDPTDSIRRRKVKPSCSSRHRSALPAPTASLRSRSSLTRARTFSSSTRCSVRLRFT